MNKILKFSISIALASILSGCSSLGLQSKRVFQKETPKPVLDVVTEPMREAAAFVAEEVEQPAEAKKVATELSQRMGLPETPVDNALEISAALHYDQKSQNKKEAKLDKFLDKYQGFELEGTGLSIWGLGSSVVIILLIGLVVVFPPALQLIFYIYKRVKGTSTKIVREALKDVSMTMDEFMADHPEMVDDLKGRFSRRMDASSKNVIRLARKGSI